MIEYLQATYYFDYEDEEIQKLITAFDKATLSDQEKTIGIYTKVRDDWRYDPYNISISKEKYKSSYLAKRTTGNCVEKSIILIACLRAMGIPARLHLGKVKNHIAVERLIEKFGTNELTPHGMVNVYLDGKWLKLSPAFNKTLCDKFCVAPLDFDGENSSFLQQFNKDGSRFMEYTEDYSSFEDVPIDFMVGKLKEYYPHIFDTNDGVTEFEI